MTTLAEAFQQGASEATLILRVKRDWDLHIAPSYCKYVSGSSERKAHDLGFDNIIVLSEMDKFYKHTQTEAKQNNIETVHTLKTGLAEDWSALCCTTS